jgi:hypothetical protein
MLRKLGLLLGLGLALVASGAQAIPIADGSVYVVIAKNGTELHLNLGAIDAPHDVNLASQIAAISAFGGSLAGATVTALGVLDRNRLSDDFGFGQQPLENIAFTTNFDPTTLDDQQIAGGMNSTVAWLNVINTVSSSTVLTSNTSSYTAVLGPDVGSQFPFTINGMADTVIPMWVATRGYADFGGPAKDVHQIGFLSVTAAGALSYVPEPGTLLLLGVGMLGLARFGGRAERA